MKKVRLKIPSVNRSDLHRAITPLADRFRKPPDKIWTYWNADGSPAGAVARWNLSSGQKEIRPLRCTKGRWELGAMPEPRPIYMLPAVMNEKLVFVCEGEKAANAGLEIGLVCTTSAGGSKAGSMTDWSPLSGKVVIILPDMDRPGMAYADEVAGKVESAGGMVRVMTLPGLAIGSGDDLHDWVYLNRCMSFAELKVLILRRVRMVHGRAMSERL